MVANNPLATKAGCDVLRAGGSAVDAAIAVRMVLTLVEPQSSGIGSIGTPAVLHMLDAEHRDYRRLQDKLTTYMT